MMELKEFVTKILVEINDGVAEAQKGGVEINLGYYKLVEFDILVTPSNDKSKEGVFVSAVELGANSVEISSKSPMTRVKFSVDILFDKKH